MDRADGDTETLPLEYDPATIGAYWARRPVSVITRIFQLLGEQSKQTSEQRQWPCSLPATNLAACALCHCFLTAPASCLGLSPASTGQKVMKQVISKLGSYEETHLSTSEWSACTEAYHVEQISSRFQKVCCLVLKKLCVSSCHLMLITDTCVLTRVTGISGSFLSKLLWDISQVRGSKRSFVAVNSWSLSIWAGLTEVMTVCKHQSGQLLQQSAWNDIDVCWQTSRSWH